MWERHHAVAFALRGERHVAVMLRASIVRHADKASCPPHPTPPHWQVSATMKEFANLASPQGTVMVASPLDVRRPVPVRTHRAMRFLPPLRTAMLPSPLSRCWVR